VFEDDILTRNILISAPAWKIADALLKDQDYEKSESKRIWITVIHEEYTNSTGLQI